MWWQVTVSLVDRQRGLAVLTARCAERNMVLLELRVRHSEGGHLVDEARLVTPGGVTARDVEDLFADIAVYGDVVVVPLPAPEADLEGRAKVRTLRRPRPARQLVRVLAGAAVMLATRRS